jgi:hypothetical protein
MKPKQRAEELLFGLKRTGEKEVCLHLSHVCEVLGIDKATQLCVAKTSLQEDVKIKRKIRTTHTGIGVFNRQDVIDAIESSGILDERTTSQVPAFRFAAGSIRTNSTVVRDAWRKGRKVTETPSDSGSN